MIVWNSVSMIRITRFGFTTLLLVLLLLSCIPGGKKKVIPTGVEVIQLPDNSQQIIATGRASANAISKDSIGMMQTTSREAASLILKSELSNQSKYRNPIRNYKTLMIEYLERGEYCRITGVYSPYGKERIKSFQPRDMEPSVRISDPGETESLDRKILQ